MENKKVKTVEDTAVYNSVEILLQQWVIGLIDRLPKTKSMELYALRLHTKINDLLDSIVFAYEETEASSKLEMVTLSLCNLQSIKTVIRTLWGLKDTNGTPLISHKQYGNFLKQVNDIHTQLNFWRNSIMKHCKDSKHILID